jgi:hypothetical protein
LHYAKEDHSGLFKSIVMRLMATQRSAGYQDPSRTRVVISAFLIDNLSPQCTGLNLFLSNNREYSAILHVRCSVHMPNLVMSIRRDGGTLAGITQVLSDLQLLLRRRDMVAFIGNKCPTVVASRWFYLVDVLEFLLKHRAAISSYFLIRHANDPLILTCLSEEVFKLHAMSLPLKLMRLAVESRDCALKEIVSLL